MADIILLILKAIFAYTEYLFPLYLQGQSCKSKIRGKTPTPHRSLHVSMGMNIEMSINH